MNIDGSSKMHWSSFWKSLPRSTQKIPRSEHHTIWLFFNVSRISRISRIFSTNSCISINFPKIRFWKDRLSRKIFPARSNPAFCWGKVDRYLSQFSEHVMAAPGKNWSIEILPLNFVYLSRKAVKKPEKGAKLANFQWFCTWDQKIIKNLPLPLKMEHTLPSRSQ